MKDFFLRILVLGLFFLFTLAPLKVGASLDSQIYDGSEIPVILPRAIWENSPDLTGLLDWYPEEGEAEQEDGKISPPDYSSIDRIIIHDMGCDARQPGCNDRKLNPLVTIQNIYRYHAVTRGWGDIGYHFIIDYWGNIYEGRYGGNGVRGAHTYYDRKCDNFNLGSVGILLMGNYEKTELPEIMYKNLIRLVAWIAVTNELNPKELNHASEIWHSPKRGSGCDISQGGLTSAYIGPVVVGHGEIEEGNSDPGLVSLNRVRKEAGGLLAAYKNYLYKTKESPEVYSIKNGALSSVQPDSSKRIITLNKNQLHAFPLLSKRLYLDDTLVKSHTRDRVYLIIENKRRPIFSEKLFNLRGYNWNNIVLLPDRELAAYSLGGPLIYPNGILIKGEGPEVYFIENNKRRHISSKILFENKKFKWEDIIQISQNELLAHPLGEKIIFSDGTLIKEEKSPPVYLVKNKKRHWIKTLQVFLSLGYKWQNIISLSSKEIEHYAVGSTITSSEDLLKLSLGAGTSVSPTKAENIEEVNETTIRVGIYKVPTNKSITIRASGPYEVYKNGVLFASKKSNETINISYSQTNFYKFIPQDEDVIFEIVSYENRPKWNPEINDNYFRGIIEIKYSPISKSLWVINELSLENYLKGLAEALNNDSSEYLKALIVAARSYALFHIQNGGKVSGEIFHLRNWSYDQLYKGYGFEKRASNIVKAVEETAGIIAIHNDKPIRGVYSSDSGGETKGACRVFGGTFCNNENYFYLTGGVKDPQGTVHDQAAVLASHGVGMSSVGARRLAELGKTFEEILKYYYLNVEIEKLY